MQAMAARQMQRQTMAAIVRVMTTGFTPIFDRPSSANPLGCSLTTVWRTGRQRLNFGSRCRAIPGAPKSSTSNDTTPVAKGPNPRGGRTPAASGRLTKGGSTFDFTIGLEVIACVDPSPRWSLPGGFTDHTSLRRGTARLLELAEGNKRLVHHAGARATRLAQLEEQIGRRARKASDTKALAHSGRHPPATDQASSASAVPSLGTLAPAATFRGLDRRRAANPPNQRQLPLRWRGPRHGAIRLTPFRR